MQQKKLNDGTELVSPLIYCGKSYPDYWIDIKLGDIWSTKGKYFKRLLPRVAGGCKYPRLAIQDAESIPYGRKDVMVHKAAAETLLSIPKPVEIPQNIWDQTHILVKKLVSSNMQVNHIDHDPNNYNPSNLEFVTGKENVEKYQEHRWELKKEIVLHE